MAKADSNTERSQYKHSKLRTMRAIQIGSRQGGERDRGEFKEMWAGEAREEPMAALMQVTGSNVRNEHLVLCAPGCIGVYGAGDFS